MRNIRLWTDDSKRFEAVWLEYLLTLIGCVVCKYRIDEKSNIILKNTRQYKYLDILLTGFNTSDFIQNYIGSSLWICGDTLVDNPCIIGVSASIKLEYPNSLELLMNDLSSIITRNKKEIKAIKFLTNQFIRNESILFKSIYTITELFCSRKFDYTVYKNIEILIQAISNLEEFLEIYIKDFKSDLTYTEMFSIVYLQNLLNEGYIKARKHGGNDTSLLLRNANYILKYESEVEAVHLLKLQILHNCINFSERPDDILSIISEQQNQGYLDKALCEIGNIYREIDGNSLKYYESLNQSNIENYKGLYRLGLVYEEKAKNDIKYYINAKEVYENIVKLISSIELKYRTPQEFEYLCKARYAIIMISVKLDKMNCLLLNDKRIFYENELKVLIEDCRKYNQLNFIRVIYNNEVFELMKEEMNKVQIWSKNLLNEIGGSFS